VTASRVLTYRRTVLDLVDEQVDNRLLPESTWRQRAAQHAGRADQWTIPHLERRHRGEKHPVMDFLFEYYPYSPGRLRTWHPGLGVELLGNWAPASCSSGYVRGVHGFRIDPLTADAGRLFLTLRILEGTMSRPAQHSCFGMHEWAMVYQAAPADFRHAHLPLRLTMERIDAAVHEVGLRCTHIDAFRFFTEAAAPLNAVEPRRANQPQLEQPGCIHANMDLFKYAMWFQPHVPGELVLDCFELAVHAREVDMRASPYDVSAFGYAPIAIETPEGRQEYAREQRLIAERAQVLRAALVSELRAISAAATPVPSA
jgi:hypothetical protein